MVVNTIASQQEGSRFNSRLRPFCVEFACSPRVCIGSLWVLRLPPTVKNMHVRLIGVSKIVLWSECERVCGCLSLCGPVMDWRPVQGVPDGRWDRLQPPHDPTDGLSGFRKWMDD